MSFTYDTSTNLGRVRLLITDRDASNQIFSDEEIEAFLALEDDDVFLAAAAATETIARNEALVLKVIEVLDLKTDGAKVAAELRASARDLRARSEQQGAFAIIEQIDSPTAWRERMRKNAMRGAI